MVLNRFAGKSVCHIQTIYTCLGVEVLLLIYLVFVLLLSTVHLSLLKGEKLQWLAVVVPGLICAGCYGFSMGQGNQTLQSLWGHENWISAIAILLTFETILIVFLTVLQIKSYYRLLHPALWKWLSVMPSFQLVVTLIFLQTYLFLNINGQSFSLLAAFFFLGSVAGLGLLTLGFQSLVKKWENRAEIKSLIALFQLLLAMFLPLIARGEKVGFTQLTADYFSISFTLVLLLVLVAVGYRNYQQKNKQQT